MWVNQFWTKIVNRAQQLAILSSPISASIGCIKKKILDKLNDTFYAGAEKFRSRPPSVSFPTRSRNYHPRVRYILHTCARVSRDLKWRVSRGEREKGREKFDVPWIQASKRNCAIPVIISPGSVTFRCCDDVCNDAERDISARLFGVIELDETFRDQVNIRRIGSYLWSEYFLILFPLSLSILQLLTIFLRIATRWNRNSIIMSYEDNLLPILSILLSKKQFDDISNNVETQIT